MEDIIRQAVLSVWVDNEPSVLARVIGLFSGRGYNIDSLTVATVDGAGTQSRINIATSGTEQVIMQIKAQLGRLVPVHKVADLSRDGHPCLGRELALVRVSCADEGVHAVGRVFSARVAGKASGSIVFEMVGSTEVVDAFLMAMRPFGVVDVSRSGIVAIDPR